MSFLFEIYESVSTKRIFLYISPFFNFKEKVKQQFK